MATKKTGKAGGKKLGMVGCGTPEMMFRSQVKKQFGSVDGVVGIEVKKDKIVLRVVSDEVAKSLPTSYRGRAIETVVTGVISKRVVK